MLLVAARVIGDAYRVLWIGCVSIVARVKFLYCTCFAVHCLWLRFWSHTQQELNPMAAILEEKWKGGVVCGGVVRLSPDRPHEL